MRRLWINGLHAGMEGVGQGVYAQRLLAMFARHVESAACEITVVMPEQQAARAAELLRPLHIEGRRLSQINNPLLRATDWNIRFFALPELREKGTIAFSPGSGWGLRTPRTLAMTYHDCIYRHFSAYMGRRFARAWLTRRAERFLRHAKTVFTESEHAARDIHQLLGIAQEKIAVIPAWLPPEYSVELAQAQREAVRQKYRLPDRYWLYVGGYDIRKNVEFMIRAYTEAQKRSPCPPLVLAGRIPTTVGPTLCNVLGALNASGLNRNAFPQPGFIANEDLPSLYAGAELFVYPSLMEGYGLPPLEAMGCGCPAIVADNSSLREVVLDASYRFDTSSTGQLVSLFLRAAESPLTLDPSFRRDNHDETQAAQAYWSVLKAME